MEYITILSTSPRAGDTLDNSLTAPSIGRRYGTSFAASRLIPEFYPIFSNRLQKLRDTQSRKMSPAVSNHQTLGNLFRGI